MRSNWWPLTLINKRPMVFKFPHRKHRKLWTSADRIRRPDLYEGRLILPYQNRSGTPLFSYPSWCRRTVDLPTICSCDALVNLVYLEGSLGFLDPRHAGGPLSFCSLTPTYFGRICHICVQWAHGTFLESWCNQLSGLVRYIHSFGVS